MINSCPDCRGKIPFLLTNKQLDQAFMCKCGHLLANLHSSSWKEWRGPDSINQNQDVFNWVQNIHEHQYHSSRFQNDLLRICSDAFKKVEEGLLKSILVDHRHCISQLKELKKADKFADFPIICPYAYAYVFWRTSLLKEDICAERWSIALFIDHH